MPAAPVRPILSRVGAVWVAAVLGLTLSACGSDDSSDLSGAPSATTTSDTSSAAQGDQSDSGSEDLDQPDTLLDFPLPDDYTVVTSGSRDGSWTAVLQSTTDWEELEALYRDELPRAGWTVDSERPTAAENGIRLEASKDDMEAAVSMSAADGGTDILINVVKQ